MRSWPTDLETGPSDWCLITYHGINSLPLDRQGTRYGMECISLGEVLHIARCSHVQLSKQKAVPCISILCVQYSCCRYSVGVHKSLHSACNIYGPNQDSYTIPNVHTYIPISWRGLSLLPLACIRPLPVKKRGK